MKIKELNTTNLLFNNLTEEGIEYMCKIIGMPENLILKHPEETKEDFLNRYKVYLENKQPLSTKSSIIEFAKKYDIDLKFDKNKFPGDIWISCEYKNKDQFDEFKKCLKENLPISFLIFGFYINGEKL